MRTILKAILLWNLTITSALAEDGWSCSNDEMEITCDGDSCDISEDGTFTPTGLSVVPGYMSYCAYSGCWEGVPYITLTENSFYAVGSDLRWSHGNNSDIHTVQVAINTSDGRGVIIGGGFAMPVKCQTWECHEDCKSNLLEN